MKITKRGHCRMLIEDNDKRILTDPGSYTIQEHSQLRNLDYILYTHEHGDHFHLDSLKVIVQHNPKAAVIANSSVSALLDVENIAHQKMMDGDELEENGIKLSAIGELHQKFHDEIPQSENTGYFINDRFWYPGDAFTNPNRDAEILALPVAGPWMSVGDAIDYALLIKPKVAIPVHDGLRYGATHK